MKINASVIKLENVVKTYRLGEDEFFALNGVNLDIPQGEFVAIVGPSGSGKSTLMHIIGLLDHPTSGKVYLEGKEIGGLSQEETAALRNKHIGFIFQAFNLLPRTSAVENVALPLIYAGISDEERIERALAAIEMVGLINREGNTPAQLSGGQQQRVAIARALVNNPSLILADEPTGNLDSKSGHEILALPTDINKKGNTVVLVTHDLGIAASAKRIVEIMDGKIVKDRKT
jgi:putative ABC transport system ATP-binding protein